MILIEISIVIVAYHSSKSATEETDRLLEVTIAEISDIRMCHECYLNKKENPDKWFTMVCNEPHLLVWVKRKSCEPYWPAKLMTINDDDSSTVNVRFFSDGSSKDDNNNFIHRLVTVASNDCLLYTEHCPYVGSNNCCTMHPLMRAEQVNNSMFFSSYKMSKFHDCKSY